MSARAKPKLGLRPFLPADTPLLAEIFRASIAELTGDDYSESQQEAWAASADDEAEDEFVIHDADAEDRAEEFERLSTEAKGAGEEESTDEEVAPQPVAHDEIARGIEWRKR